MNGEYINTQANTKQKAITKYKERFQRVKHIFTEFDKDLISGYFCELELRPKGLEMTITDKMIRKYERVLGISKKGNVSKKARNK